MAEERQKAQPKVDPDDLFNFFCSLAILKQEGDTERLAKIKEECPIEYANWEQCQAKIDAEKAKEQAKP